MTHVRGFSSSRSDCIWKCREHGGDGLALTKYDLEDLDGHESMEFCTMCLNCLHVFVLIKKSLRITNES